VDQLPIPGVLTTSQRANRISRRAHKKRSRLPVLQPRLPVWDSTFAAAAGVPATRGDCPTAGYCPHVRCRYHLALETGEHRAGRPGLSSVPRDAQGRTLPVCGDAGEATAGTTLRPTWLQVRGMEIEREVKVYVSADGSMHEVRMGTLDYWLARLHVGEPVLVFDDDAVLIAKAKRLADGTLAMDRALPERVVQSAAAVVLTRVRAVESCALEVAGRGMNTNTQTGDALGKHRTLMARYVRRALAKAVRVAAQMGMTEGDLLRGLRELGAR
jgi:hypothetical protein